MILHDFSSTLIEDYLESPSELSEKWEVFDAGWAPVKLWHSDSISEFRSFLQNVGNTGISGLRLSIKNDTYLAANAADLTHDNMVDLAVENYLTPDRKNFEWSTCGFPKIENFDGVNVENAYFDDTNYINSDINAEYALFKNEDILDEYAAVIWTSDGKPHTLIADCGTFEIALYNFYSQQFAEFRYGDNPERPREKKLFEASETYKAIKPLIKKLYMTNM